MAHGETRVPQRVEQRFGERRRVLRSHGLRIDDEDDVGVAAKRDGSATEAADSGEGHAARQPRVALRALEQQAEARVQEARVCAPEGHAVLPRLEPRDEALSVAIERIAQRERLERRGRDAPRRTGGHGHVRAPYIPDSL